MLDASREAPNPRNQGRRMAFKYLNFVVTGCPRSGTQYVARILQQLGYDCLHEASFNPWQAVFAMEHDDRPWGDSSWMAVPFLSWLPPETAIIHLVRDPLRTINSIVGTGQLDWPTDYRRFLAHHFMGDSERWPEDLARIAQDFWVEWNQRIMGTERVRLRVKVEEFVDRLPEVIHLIDPQRVLTARDVSRVESIPRDENSRPHLIRNAVDYGDLTDECRLLARTLGYPYYL
jgi:hypothetical protein